MKTTSVYKQTGDLTIHTDVYRPATKDVLPVVVWIHGGALINGQRSSSGLDERKWVRPRFDRLSPGTINEAARDH